MPPTNAELTAQVEQLTTEKAELEAKVAELEAAPAPEPEPADGVSTEAHEAVLAENEALKVEVEKAREERDRAKEQASGASQNAEAIQQVQDHPGSVLNPNGQDTVPKEMPLSASYADGSVTRYPGVSNDVVRVGCSYPETTMPAIAVEDEALTCQLTLL